MLVSGRKGFWSALCGKKDYGEGGDEGDDEVMVKGGTVQHRKQQHGTLGNGLLWRFLRRGAEAKSQYCTPLNRSLGGYLGRDVKEEPNRAACINQRVLILLVLLNGHLVTKRQPC